MVLSYTTSPAYHLIAEEDATKAAAPLTKGHYLQIEVAGKLKASDQPELADQFLHFMVSDSVPIDYSNNELDVSCRDPCGWFACGFEHC